MSSEKSTKEPNRPKLQVFNEFASEALRPGYAYLVRSDVRMPELYPLLGELLFASSITYSESDLQNGTGKKTPNLIGMFIEDTPDNLMLHLGKPDRFHDEQDVSFLERFGCELQRRRDNKAENYGNGIGMAAWLDTYGQFQELENELTELDITKVLDGNWWQQSIPGAGNPMNIIRFFRLVQEKQGQSDLNLFLLNSLSNLYRNLELTESAAFLKTMLNESIWAIEARDDSHNICDNHGIFLATLQEGVLEKKEASYLESFFDGIISVSPCVINEQLRVVRVKVKALPEMVAVKSDFIYLPKWRYEKDTNKNEDKKYGGGWRDKEYIYVRKVDDIIKKYMCCEN